MILGMKSGMFLGVKGGRVVGVSFVLLESKHGVFSGEK